FISSFSNLQYLNLSYAQFSGIIPHTLGNLSLLHYLDLGSSYYNCLSENNFGGVIPESLGNLGTLGRLDLSRNKLNGSILEFLNNLTNLVYFDLSHKNFGKLPRSIGRLQKLGIGDLRRLQYLDLSFNMFTGVIPESFGNLTLLQDFYGAGNKLNRKLPKGIDNFCYLQILDFITNFISGGIDDLIDGLSNCRKNKDGSTLERKQGLETLRMGNNMLNGTVLRNIGKLSKLKELDLSSNSLMGSLTKSHFVN
ncbi:Non-specific serine/threonine protein kinase protein, partial [Dioscorea alata]